MNLKGVKELKDIQVRHRTRAKAVAGSGDTFLDAVDRALSTAEENLPSALPRDLGERVVYLRERADAGERVVTDLREFVYTTILRLRHLHLPVIEIARQLHWSEEAVWYHLKPAKKWFAKQMNEKLDPFELLAHEFMKLEMMDERAMAKVVGESNMTDFQKAAMVALGTSKSKAEWLERYGYFDAINFHRMRGGDADSAEARADMVRKGLFDAFDNGDDAEILQPVATENENEDAVAVVDEMDDWPD